MAEPEPNPDADPGYVWRLTKPESGSVKLEAGPKLATHPPNAYLPIIGRALIHLGTNPMQPRVTEGDDEDDDWDGD